MKGLCDNVDTSPEQFGDYEACFSLRAPASPNHPQQPAPLMLRVRKSQDINDAPLPYQLRYIGQPELGDDKRPTLVRSSIDINCTAGIIEFLTELGCRLEFEYTIRGNQYISLRLFI